MMAGGQGSRPKVLQLPLRIADVPCFGNCSPLLLPLVLEGKLRVEKLLLVA
jgi:hypothetical protein